jgi:hypothetical protein
MIRHANVLTRPNNPAKEVSTDAWNDAHVGTNDHAHTGTGDGGLVSYESLTNKPTLLQGEQGIQGLQGEQGLPGATGQPGYTPVKGVDYFDGATGTQGAQGLKGDKGDRGDTGGVGSQGIQGLPGVDGTQGTQGIQGIKGDTGNTGLQGDQGVQGIKGDTGDAGPQGMQGTQGIQGEQGIPGVTTGYAINVQALTSTPVDSQTVYFGMLPKAPITTANVSRVYVRKAGTIKIAEIYTYSGTAGTAENWSLYIRKNNTTDYLIATLALNTNMRVFTNTSLDIAMAAGDYFEIKGVQPLWATNPATCIYAGYVYLE